MKTKHIFKIFTIIMMLMLAIFTTGCESQQEKYTKASNELATYEKEKGEYFFNAINKIDEIMKDKTNGTKQLKELAKLYKEVKNNINEYEKITKEKLENLQKIAKGNPELEKDVHIKWEENNKKTKAIIIYKKQLEEIEKIIEEELAKQK